MKRSMVVGKMHIASTWIQLIHRNLAACSLLVKCHLRVLVGNHYFICCMTGLNTKKGSLVNQVPGTGTCASLRYHES
jgi:hypothetical protein